MAIIHCPHCGMQISSSAVNCPCCRGLVAAPPMPPVEAPVQRKEGATVWENLLGTALAGVLTWVIFSMWNSLSVLQVGRYYGDVFLAAFSMTSALLSPVVIRPILIGAVLYIVVEQAMRHKGKYAPLGGCIAALVLVLIGYVMMRSAWGNVLRSGVIPEQLIAYAESLQIFYGVGIFLLQGGLSLAGYGRRLLWRLLFTVVAAALAALLVFFLLPLLGMALSMGMAGVAMAGTAAGVVVLAAAVGAAMVASK